ncbi:hydroxycarboxylic acid receptor 2-like [Antennarius striatus]|uniref:hydroxycarboxylic acid receptor 2-like n=1 Tax=Antennarius striatus TaxID=241820 RepID=UPI0035B2252C
MLCYFNGTVLINVLPTILMTEIVLGITGNGLALWIFCFHMRPWKSSTVLLFNLAVADFLLILALPFRASYYISGIKWMFGDTLCKTCLFMLAMNRSGSTFFLMAIAADRFMRVVYPHHPINTLSVFKATCGALVLWLVTISMTVHVFNLATNNTTYCESFMIDSEPHRNLNWHKFEFLLSFIIPLLVIFYCTVLIINHLRMSRLARHATIKKTLCFLSIVAVLFFVCFLPSNIMQVLIWIKTHKLASSPLVSEVCPALEDLSNAFYITVSLTYLNSVLDPVVYYFSSPAFSRICRKILNLHQESITESTPREAASQSISQL